MPRVRDLLYRFRPAGAPGAASGAGVPADCDAAVRAELEPLFALLAATTQECADIVARAERDAEARRAADAERARSLRARAREQVAPERAAAAAAFGQRVADNAAQTMAAAEREVRQLRLRVDERAPAMVDLVVDAVKGLITADHVADENRDGAA